MKLVVAEAESEALRAVLAGEGVRAMSSSIAAVEVGRAARRVGADAREVLEALDLLEPTRAVLARAVEVEPVTLRAIDALHVASALFVEGLSAFVAYDQRLSAAAEAAGLRVLTPGTGVPRA